MKEAQKLMKTIRKAEVGVEPTQTIITPQYGVTGGDAPSAKPWTTRVRELLDTMKKTKKEASGQLTSVQIGQKLKNSGWKAIESNRFKQPTKIKDPQGNTWGMAGRGVWKVVG